MRKISILFISLLLLSCIGTHQYETDYALGVLADDYAILYVSRPSMFGSAVAAPVYVNGVQIAQMGPGGHITKKIPLGKIVVTSTTNNVSFEAKKGYEYYVDLNFRASMWLHTPDIDVNLVNITSPK